MTSSGFGNNSPSRKFRRHFLTAAVLSLLLPVFADAQPKFQLQRTKQESAPFIMRLLGGYNGVSEPSDALQDIIENTETTQWGGVMVVLQGLFVIDTIGVPLLLGGDVYYHRMAKRWLGYRGDVYYSSDGSPVNTSEVFGGYGGHALVGLMFAPWLNLQLGVGALYINSAADVESDVTGLFQPVWMLTAQGSVTYAMLRYEHGSIDATFRLTRGFGKFGSTHFQSLLGFTFTF